MPILVIDEMYTMAIFKISDKEYHTTVSNVFEKDSESFSKLDSEIGNGWMHVVKYVNSMGNLPIKLIVSLKI